MASFCLATGLPKEVIMLSKYFEAPERIRAIRSGPYGALIEGFADQLFQRGYAQISARRHIRAAEHFVRWAVHRGLSDHDLNVQILERFAGHLSRCRCGRYCCAKHVEVVAGARLFLRHLQGVDEPPIRGQKPVSRAGFVEVVLCMDAGTTRNI
jgi:hypothetical protein